MNELDCAFPSLPGAYLLVLTATQAATIRVGRLGQQDVTPGCYLYAGSALGAGGLRGRLRHHLHVATRPHWHVDYLLDEPDVALAGVWAWRTAAPLESALAAWLAAQPGITPLAAGLGASDDRGQTHLLRLASGE